MLLASAVLMGAGLSALIGCTQLQTHESLLDLIKDRQGTNSTAQPVLPAQQSSAGPRESTTTTVPAYVTDYVIESPDEVIIIAVLKDPKTGTATHIPNQPITGAYRVREDGTVGLGSWGSVPVVGLKVDEVAAAVRKRLVSSPLIAPIANNLTVSVDIAAYGSKKYYVITESLDDTDQVYAFPATGVETVRDAIAGVDGLAERAKQKSVRVARKRSDGGPDEVLPVDWIAITRGVMKTNYQLQSGDRVYVTNK
jgi:protein involved in polysaccharide export with SLBB domain